MNLYSCSFPPLTRGGVGSIKIWLLNSISPDNDKPANSEKICQTSSATAINFIKMSEWQYRLYPAKNSDAMSQTKSQISQEDTK